MIHDNMADYQNKRRPTVHQTERILWKTKLSSNYLCQCIQMQGVKRQTTTITQTSLCQFI